jgi:uncharacterized repeat protein (TIGR01451 family)
MTNCFGRRPKDLVGILRRRRPTLDFRFLPTRRLGRQYTGLFVLQAIFLSLILLLIPQFATAQQSCVFPPSGIVAWWPGEGNFQDIVGAADGSAVGTAAFAPGEVGNAFSVDANFSVAAPMTNLPVGNADRTMELWVRIDAYNSIAETFIAGYGVDGNVGGTFRLSTDKFGDVFVSTSGSDFFPPANLALHQSHHMAVTVAGGMVTIFVDGGAVGQQAMIFNTLTDHFYIGRFSANQWLQGLADEVTVYNRALTAAEVHAIYAAGRAGKCKSGLNLSIATSPDIDPGVGGDLIFTPTVTNGGPQNATNVTLVDTLPGGVTFVSASPSQGTCNASGGTISCNLGDLPSLATASIAIRVTPTTRGTLIDTAQVSAPGFDSRSATVTVEVHADAPAWTNIGPVGRGRVHAVAVDPGNLSHWLLGAAGGGVWETLDAGTTWTPKTDDQASLNMGYIAFAPSNPNVVYAGTGEFGRNGGPIYSGAGLLKSTDGSNTWTLLAPATFTRAGFTGLRVHQANPDILVAATAPGTIWPGYLPMPSPPPTGILKSIDGGVTWSLKLAGQATDLDVDPTNFNNQFAGIGIANISGGVANGVYRSTNAGETWTRISGAWDPLIAGEGRVAIAVAPSNPSTVYVGVEDSANGVALFRTDNAWASTPTWTRIPNMAGTDGFCFNACSWGMVMLIDTADPNTLYAGGRLTLWQCTNCGASPTWTPIDRGGADWHALAWAGKRLIFGADVGILSTTDVPLPANATTDASWTDHATNTVIPTMIHGALHPTDPNFGLAVGIDAISGMKWSGNNNWLFNAVEGSGVLISSARPDTDWAVWVAPPARTTDGGTSFVLAGSGIDLTNVSSFPPMSKCPANNDVLLAVTDNLWRSNNFFSATNPSWASNSPEMGNSITAIAFAPSDPTCSTYAFSTLLGQLRLTNNGGGTWVDLDPSNSVPNRPITGLAFDPTNANILYVTLSSFDEGTPGQPGHLFKTTSALVSVPTWVNVSPPVNHPLNTVVVDPIDPRIVYVGAIGVWRSMDGGATWAHMGPDNGMPNVVVSDLKLNRTTNRLVAFTFGRGAFVTNANVISGPPTNTLTIKSSNPNAGVNIAVSPTDKNNLTNGSTPFTRTYNLNTQVTVIAASIAGSNNFISWSGCNFSAGTTCNVIMGADMVVTAGYGPPPPPDTSISSGPAAVTNSTSAIFIFTSTDPSSTFTCSLDNVAFAACTSPKSYTKLKVGNHNFLVRATDAFGTDPTPASFFWTIDTAAPNTAITSAPPLLTNNPVATFSFTSTEVGGGFQCSLDGGLFADCTNPFISASLLDGKHNFQVKAVDAAGNMDKSVAKAKAWTVDTIRPITTITGKPTNPTTSTSATFTFTSEKKSSFKCLLDNDAAGFTACKSGQKYSGLLRGPHNFQVQATDAAGNVELAPASYGWTIQ